MDIYHTILAFLDKRIEEHNRRIDQAVNADNHYMKSICKAERAEADTIRNEILRKIK